jgi:hypothetical protein
MNSETGTLHCRGSQSKQRRVNETRTKYDQKARKGRTDGTQKHDKTTDVRRTDDTQKHDKTTGVRRTDGSQDNLDNVYRK